MKKVLLCFTALFFLAFQANAQDIIVKTDATIIRALINEIDDDTIIYHQWDDQSGPTYRIKKENVAKIQFQNGTEQTFSSLNNNSDSQSVTRLASKDKLEYIRRGDYKMGYMEITDSDTFSELPGIEYYMDTYTSAQKQRRAGKTLIPIGASTSALGVIYAVVAAIQAPKILTYTQYWDSTGKTWDKYSMDGDITMFQTFSTLAAIFMGVGTTCLSIGIPLNIIGNSRLRWIAEDYNENKGSSANLSFGFTSSGVGLALQF